LETKTAVYCEGEDIDLTEIAGDAIDWDWDGPPGSFNGQNWVINNATLSDAGTYTVTVTDVNSCMEDDMITIDVLSIPSVTMTTIDPDICFGECTTVEFTVTNGEGGPYEITYEITAGITVPVTFDLSGQTGSFMVCTTSDFFPSYDATNDIAFIPESVSSLSVMLTSIEEGTGFDLCSGIIDPTPITINLIPPPPNPNVMNETICQNQSVDLGFTNCSGTANWYADATGSTLLFSGIPFTTPLLTNTTSYWAACEDNGCESELVEITVIVLSACDASCVTVESCDDLDDCTLNDMVTLGSDGSECVSCAGTPTTTNSPMADPITICENESGTLIATGCSGVVSWYETSAGVNLLATGSIFTTPILTNSESYWLSCADNGCESELIEVEVNQIEISVTITDPPSCDAENTPSDNLDDTYTFEMTITGTNIGTGWTADDINSTTGNYNTPTSFGPFLISDGPFILNITDDQSTACATSINIVPPPPCSEECQLTDADLDLLVCNNGGTPTDVTDDFLSFTLNPSGNNLGTNYNVSVNTGSVSPISSSYGVPTSFSLQGGSAGGGDVILTISDDNDPACTIDITILDPGNCSPDCALDNAGLLLVACNSNSTASNETDDFITFSLDPTGFNLGSDYTVSVNMGSITPMVGSYGSSSSFILQNGSAGGGDVTVVITDVDDPTCSIMVTIIDPGSCSTECSLDDANLSLVNCNNGGSITDITDDFISFSLDPGGVNLGTNYTISVNTGSVSPTNSTYGAPTNFSLQGGSAGGGDVIVTITDVDDTDCMISITITDPGNCSPECSLDASGLDLVNCNSNATASDETDDFIAFILDPTGLNLGSDYNVSVDMGSVTPSTASYGTATSFSLQGGSAGAGDVILTITDVDDSDCSISITIIDPGSCSTDCSLDDTGLSAVACNNGGTDSDASDDFISFILNPTGGNLGTNYSISVNTGSVSPTNSTYGAPTNFSLQGGSAGGGDVIVTITDVDDTDCMISITITDPGNCSPECSLDDAGLDMVQCFDGGTSSDDSDDSINFILNPTGQNLSNFYNVTVNQGAVLPPNGSYGAPITFTFTVGSAGEGDVELTITDFNNPDCSITVTIVDPGTCSGDCSLDDAGLDLVACNDGGTNSDINDDFTSFILNPTGGNLGTNYNVSVNTGSISPTSSTYGSPTNFNLQGGSAGGGDVIITITDGTDPDCMIDITIPDPGSCSPECSLDDAGVDLIACNANATPSDESDDFITFTLDPTGLNLGSDYNVSVNTGGIMPSSGSYGVETSFSLQSGSAGGGDVALVITDADDPDCSITIIIQDPESCSGDCAILSSGLDLVQCFDGGTSSDDSDEI
jgi:hypothetical protein